MLVSVAQLEWKTNTNAIASHDIEEENSVNRIESQSSYTFYYPFILRLPT